LQCVAVYCSVLQCNVLQCVAVCCSVLQCVAVCCSVLDTDTHDDMGPQDPWADGRTVVYASRMYLRMLHRVAVFCSVLWYVAVFGSV